MLHQLNAQAVAARARVGHSGVLSGSSALPMATDPTTTNGSYRHGIGFGNSPAAGWNGTHPNARGLMGS